MNNKYNVAIIGAGVAGAFAALRLAEHHKNTKAIIFDLGRPPGKRRRQLEGWLGCFPTGDGKIYTNDIDKILNVADGRRAKSINRWVMEHFASVNENKIIKNKAPNANIQKKLKEMGFGLEINDFIQWQPDSVHQLSKNISERIEESQNVTFSFDNEVHYIKKDGKSFFISANDGDYYCDKIILCVGRSGWRWINNLFKDLGILVRDDIARFGIYVELSAQYMKDFNKSHCTISRDDLQIGPISWGGSIIQEDHADLTIAAFRSNENRWKTDKVFFNLIGNRKFEDNGCWQTERLGGLAFLLADNRVGREKIRPLLRNSTQLNQLPEYSWLIKSIEEISEFIPSIVSRGFFHYPSIIPLASEINISSNLETEVEGLYVAGESAGLSGIAAAAITGGIAIEGVVK